MTIVTKTFSDSVLKKSTDELSYVIPDGKTLHLDRFFAGHEYSQKEARVELVWDGTQLAVMYGATSRVDIDEDLVGDGVKSLVIRAVNQDSGALHMFGRWFGREKTTNG